VLQFCFIKTSFLVWFIALIISRIRSRRAAGACEIGFSQYMDARSEHAQHFSWACASVVFG
jgi:hypothetical protein